MIVFDLKCADQDHVFEAWFGSTEDYSDQQARGLVACPICECASVEKAPMAPRLAQGGALARADPSPDAIKQAMAELACLQRRWLEKSENVGKRFPDEARAIHLGDAEARAIHGRATQADAIRLEEDGIRVSPLLFPVPEPGEEN